jgi:flagellar biosynthesis protein FlhF
MQIKKYFAADMRQAMRAIREEQGPDAVILSNRTLADGVEISVAIDYDVDAPRSAPQRQPAGDQAADLNGLQGFRELLARREAVQARAAGPADGAVNDELRTLRRMLETQLAALAWNDMTRRAPLATELLRELSEIGFAPDIAARVADALPTDVDFTAARRLAIARIADEIATTGDRWAEFGGTVAFVGPPGAGKSSAIAKLAARWVLRHGNAGLVLISADVERVGSIEETAHLGRLMGARTYNVGSLDELPGLLVRVATARLVLIDTTGAGPRDARLAATVQALRAASATLEIALTLSASTQAGAIEEAVAVLRDERVAACILTKLDEAASLGGALSALIRAGLPVAYVSEGRRVPDDLRVARPLDLVSTAVLLAERLGAAADEDLLTRRFHGVASVGA